MHNTYKTILYSLPNKDCAILLCRNSDYHNLTQFKVESIKDF